MAKGRIVNPAPQSYDITKMLGEIMATVGTDSDPDKLRATLEQWGKEGRHKTATGMRQPGFELGSHTFLGCVYVVY